MQPSSFKEDANFDRRLQFARVASKKLSLREVEELVSGKQVNDDDEDGDHDGNRPGSLRSKFTWAAVYKLLPGARAFVSLPVWPSSPVPQSIDYGFTKTRHTIYMIMSDPDSRFGVLMFFTVILAIALSIGAFCVSTLTEYRTRAALGITDGVAEAAFDIIERVCISVFTAEYLSRLLTVTAVPNEKELAFVERHGWQSHGSKPCPLAWPATLPHAWLMVKTSAWKLVKFVLAPLNLIDVIAIAPFYYNLVYPSDVSGNMMIIRVLRLARVFRLARMSKRMEGVQILASTMYTALDALGFLTFFLVLAVIMFGTIIFFCEGGDYDPSTGQFMRPNVLGNGMEPSPFRSIPHSFWWTVVTMTTVGYGDMVPTTNAGRALGSIIMLCGVMVLALPITVVGSAFTEEYAKYKERRLMDLLVEAEKAEDELARAEEAAALKLDSGAGTEHGKLVQQHTGDPLSAPLSEPVATATSATAGQRTLSAQGSGVDKQSGYEATEHAVVDVSNSTPVMSPTRADAPPVHAQDWQGSKAEGRGKGKMAALRTKLAALTGASAHGGAADASTAKSRVSPARTNSSHALGGPAGTSSSAQREMDLLVAMRRGRARLQAVSAMETAFKTGNMPLTTEAAFTGQAYGANLNIVNPGVVGLSSSSAALAEVAEHLSAQMREQHADAVETSSVYQGQMRELKAVVQAQADSMERMRDEMHELKQAISAILQAVQMQGGLQVPGSTGS